MPVDFSGAQLGLLAGLVFLAGVVDSLAGGGGLITLPAYLAMGVMSVAGHYVGSSLGLKKGAAVIRPMLILVSGALFVKILVDVLPGG